MYAAFLPRWKNKCILPVISGGGAMNNWYGWIIEQSLDDQSIFDELPTIKMKSEEEDWKEHIVEVPDEKINDVVEFLKQHLKRAWYAHLVKDNQMIVMYKDKVFQVKEGEDYTPMREFGLSHSVPEEQLPGQGLFDQARKKDL